MLSWALDVQLPDVGVIVGRIPNLVKPRCGVTKVSEALSKFLGAVGPVFVRLDLNLSLTSLLGLNRYGERFVAFGCGQLVEGYWR